MTDDIYGKIHTDGSRSGGQPLDDGIRAKALALVNELFVESGGSPIDCAALFGKGDIVTLALLCAIEQHEAFKQEVSDAVAKAIGFCKDGRPASAAGAIGAFVIPKPKPDPLVDVAKSLGYFNTVAQHWAGDVRAALDALGFEIREKGQ